MWSCDVTGAGQIAAWSEDALLGRHSSAPRATGRGTAALAVARQPLDVVLQPAGELHRSRHRGILQRRKAPAVSQGVGAGCKSKQRTARPPLGGAANRASAGYVLENSGAGEGI